MDAIHQLELQHQEELVDLQAKIDELKLNQGNVDKKKRKGLNSKVETMRREVEVRQEKEMYELKVKVMEEEKEQVGDGEEQDKQEEDEVKPSPPEVIKPDTSPLPSHQGKKPNRRQAAKDRKAAKLQSMMDEAEQEAKDLPNLREKERVALTKVLDEVNLEVFEIPPDGHCLYSAVADQLKQLYNIESTAHQVRNQASDYIRTHIDDFIPFLTNHQGDLLSPEEVQAYCDEIANTATWGGQVEISALAQAYEIPITVYQVGSPPLTNGQDQWPDKAPLTLSYHRHAFGLGEHYNSLRVKS